jgi:hypothetical protein
MSKSKVVRDLEGIKAFIERVCHLRPASDESQVRCVAGEANNLRGKMDDIIRQVKRHWSDEL